MGFLDELKGKAGELGEKAKHGFGSAKDKASDLVEEVKSRRGGADRSDSGQDAPEQRSSDTEVQSPDAAAEVVDDNPAAASGPAIDTVDPGIDPVTTDPVTTEAAVDADADVSASMDDEAGLVEDFAADAPSSFDPTPTDSTDPDAESGADSDSGIDAEGLGEAPEQSIESGQADAETLDGDPGSTVSSS